MTDFLLLMALASLWIWGIRCLFSEGYILERTGRFIERTFPSWVYYPTLGCCACMSSIHGTLWYWIGGAVVLETVNFFVWPVFCVCLCGVNYLLLETIYRE